MKKTKSASKKNNAEGITEKTPTSPTMNKKAKAGNSTKKKISCSIHRKDCLPPPVRLRSFYLKSDQGLSEGLPKETITPIEEVKKMLVTIIKKQNQILKKMEGEKITTIPCSYLRLKSLPNLNLNK